MNFLLSKSSILIFILQLFLGFSLYTTTNNNYDVSQNILNEMSEQEKSAFNQTFLMYQGNQSGSVIKQLIETVNSSNANPDIPQQVTIYLDDAEITTSENIAIVQKYNVYLHYGDNGYIDAVRINSVQ